MTIETYINSADNRVVDKSSSLSSVESFSGALKDSTSTMKPTFILQVQNYDALKNVNYIHVPEFDTYYFVRDIKMLPANRVEFDCEEDLLMTYHTPIKNLTCVVSRQENLYNQYLDDPEFKVYNYRRVQTRAFPNGFNKGNSQFVLAITGGASNG